MLLFGPSTRTAGTEEEGFSGSEQGGVLSLLTTFDLIVYFFPDLWLIYCRRLCVYNRSRDTLTRSSRSSTLYLFGFFKIRKLVKLFRLKTKTCLNAFSDTRVER